MELDHVANWAAKNNLSLNTNKSSEMVILRKGKTAPPPIRGIKRVSNMVILGVTTRDDLHTVDHVDKLISTCTRSLYCIFCATKGFTTKRNASLVLVEYMPTFCFRVFLSM